MPGFVVVKTQLEMRPTLGGYYFREPFVDEKKLKVLAKAAETGFKWECDASHDAVAQANAALKAKEGEWLAANEIGTDEWEFWQFQDTSSDGVTTFNLRGWVTLWIVTPTTPIYSQRMLRSKIKQYRFVGPVDLEPAAAKFAEDRGLESPGKYNFADAKNPKGRVVVICPHVTKNIRYDIEVQIEETQEETHE